MPWRQSRLTRLLQAYLVGPRSAPAWVLVHASPDACALGDSVLALQFGHRLCAAAHRAAPAPPVPDGAPSGMRTPLPVPLPPSLPTPRSMPVPMRWLCPAPSKSLVRCTCRRPYVTLSYWWVGADSANGEGRGNPGTGVRASPQSPGIPPAPMLPRASDEPHPPLLSPPHPVHHLKGSGKGNPIQSESEFQLGEQEVEEETEGSGEGGVSPPPRKKAPTQASRSCSVQKKRKTRPPVRSPFFFCFWDVS